MSGGASRLMGPKPGPSRSTVMRPNAIHATQLRSVLRINALEQTVFSVAYVTVRNNELPPAVSWVLEVVEDVQLFGFALNNHFHPDLPSALMAIFTPIDFFTAKSYSTLVALTGIALTLILLTVLLALYIGLMVHWSINIPIFALRLQRLLFTLQMTVLTIPMAEVMMLALDCKQAALHYQLSCVSTSYLPLLIMSALGLIVFIPLMLVGSLVFIDNSSTATSPNAKSHGRMDFRTLLLRYCFAALATFATGTTVGDTLTMVAIGLSLLYLFIYSAYNRPYFDQRMTNTRAAFFAGSCGTMWATLICYSTGLSGGWASVAIPVGAVCFLLGYVATEKWSTLSFRKTIRLWHRVQRKEEDKAREKFAGGKPSRSLPNSRPDEETADEIVETGGGLAPPKMYSRDSLSPPSPAMSRSATAQPVSINTSMEALKIASEKRAVDQARVFSSPVHVEACIRFLRQNPTQAQASIGWQLIQRGLAEFPDDSLMYFFAATYIAAHFWETEYNRAAELMEECKKRKPPFDVKFLVYAKERDELDQRKVAAGGGDNEQLHVLESTEYQNLDRQVRLQHLLALQAMRDFWEAVRTGRSPGTISSVLSRISNHSVLAEVSYSRLLAKFPTSKNVMRAYANFLTSVQADIPKATQLIQLADAAEAREERNADARYVRTSILLARLENPDDEVFPRGSPIRAEAEPFKPGPVTDPGPDEFLGEPEPPSATAAGENRSTTFRVPGKAQSQTSGTSFSRAQRQIFKARRSLALNISKPVRQNLVINAALVAMVGLLIAGYLVCGQFFSQTQGLVNHEFKLAITSQSAAAYALEDMNRIVVINYWQDITSFNSTITELTYYLRTLHNTVVPFLADESVFDTENYRVYARITNPANSRLVDYMADDAGAIDLVNSLVRAAGAVLSYNTYGALTISEFMNITDGVFVMDNLQQYLECLNRLPLYGVQIFIQKLSSQQALMLALASATTLLTAGIGALLYQKVCRQFFSTEDRVIRIFRDFSKRAATQLVTQFEEDAELFREVTDVEDLEDFNATKFTDAEGHTAVDRTDNRLLTISTRILVITMLAIMGLMAGMYGVTLQSMSVRNHMSTAVTSYQRSFYVQAFRLAARSLVLPGNRLIVSGMHRLLFMAFHELTVRILTLETNIKILRGLMRDLDLTHDQMSAPACELNDLFPTLTTYPRDCSSNSADPCANLAFNETVGFMRTIASASLNDEITKFLSIANTFTNLGVVSSAGSASFNGSGSSGSPALAVSPDQISQDSPIWVLVKSITADINSRIGALNSAIVDYINHQIYLNWDICTTIFVANMVVACSAAVYLHRFGLRVMKHRANTLAALFMVIPQSMWKDLPMVQKVVESGGTVLSQMEFEQKT